MRTANRTKKERTGTQKYRSLLHSVKRRYMLTFLLVGIISFTLLHFTARENNLYFLKNEY